MTRATNTTFDELKKAYSSHGIVLVLGAGVSIGSNIPSWDDLISKMVNDRLGEADGEAFKELKDKFDLTTIASFLQNRYSNFPKAVRDALYDAFPFNGRRVDKYTRGEFIRYIRYGKVKEEFRKPGQEYKPNLTLRSIGALCTVRRKERNRKGNQVLRNFANPKVNAIITLNMDPLLQTYVYAFSTKHLIRTMEKPLARSYEKRINIYHMHGYLHFANEMEADKTILPPPLVLAEQDYYDFFNQPNSMFNYTFLFFMRESPCLFIGLSMQDVNIRRLLHLSNLERLQALEKSGIPFAGGKMARNYAILSRNENPHIDSAQEETLGALGVKILWVDDYSEIPVILKRLYTSLPEDKDHWAYVYGKEKPVRQSFDR